MNTLVPWDKSFPLKVQHFANKKVKLTVRYYGLESTPIGAVPVVAEDNGRWYAGQSDLDENGIPTLYFVNMYGDLLTALSYAQKIYTF